MKHGESFNLEHASILILDQDEISMGIMAQILTGFGARQLTRSTQVEDALKLTQSNVYDLIIVDATVLRNDAFDFIRRLRREGSISNRFSTVLVTTGHATDQRVAKARDAGAHFIVAKPLRPDIILKRIQWLSEDKRDFVEADGYIGPDRRHKYEGPPPGQEGRRQEDQDFELGDASNDLFQEEIDRLVQPRKIEL